MNKAFAVSLGVLFLCMSAAAQAKPDVKPPAPVVASAPDQPPAELVSEFAEWSALNKVVAQIKAEDGLPKLENELEQRRLKVLDTAAKAGFHFDPATSTFVKDAPKVDANPAAPVTPTPTAPVPAAVKK